MKKSTRVSLKKHKESIVIYSATFLIALLFVLASRNSLTSQETVLGTDTVSENRNQNTESNPWWWWGATPTPTISPEHGPTPTPTTIPTNTPTLIPTSIHTPTPMPTNFPTQIQNTTQQPTATEIPTQTPTSTPTNASENNAIHSSTQTPTQTNNQSTNPINNIVNYVVNQFARPTQTPTIHYATPTGIGLLTATPTPILTSIITELKSDGSIIILSDGELQKLSDILKNDDRPEIKRGPNNTTRIIKNNAEAQTTFPLSINITTKDISITTETGPKIIHISPDQVATIITQQQLVTSIGGKATFAYLLYGPGNQNQPVVMQLSSLNGDPVYIVEGTVDKKLFSFIPVSINKTIYISADSGEVIYTKINAGNSIINALSQ